MSEINFSEEPVRFGNEDWQLVPNSGLTFDDQIVSGRFNKEEEQKKLEIFKSHPLRKHRAGIQDWHDYIRRIVESDEKILESRLKIETIEATIDQRDKEYHGYIYYSEKREGKRSKPLIIEAEFKRPLKGFTPYQIRGLKFLELMDEYGVLEYVDLTQASANIFLNFYISFIWDDGKAEILRLNASKPVKEEPQDPKDLIQYAFNKVYGKSNADMAVFKAFSNFASITKSIAWSKMDDPYYSYLREQYQEFAYEQGLSPLPPLTDEYIANKGKAPEQENPYKELSVFIGMDDNRQQIRYSGEGSVISIAAPRSGKTQTHILPNLLSWRAPAIVLDIKGELWQKSAGWRSKNVGRCIRFAPLEPENSHCYNPILQVRKDPDYVWEDSVFLASMILPKSKHANDPFWEDQAIRLIASAIASSVEWDEPSLNFVIDVVNKDPDRWAEFMSAMMHSKVAAMKRSFTSIAHLESEQPKTLAGILSTAQNALNPWQGERVERVTQSSDWTPDILRDPTENATIYINLRPGELDSAYAGMLRVMVGQHIRGLMQHNPEIHPRPILFMLDEMVRLGRMPIIEEALEVGAQYGVRLFPAIQYVDHLKTTARHPEGFLGAFAARAYMNPTNADGTAEKLSKEFGMTDSITDGRRKPLVEASDLTGEDYRDKVLVFAHGQSPVIGNKAFAYQNPVLNDRMHIKPPIIQR